MSEITYPIQIVLVSCRAETEILGKIHHKEDIITVAWHMQVSFEPELYAISIDKDRFSRRLITESRAFVVNFIPYELKDQALFCGTRSGKHLDKFRESGLAAEESNHIECPRIREAVAFIECEVIDEIEAGDHIIFIGKVVHSELKEHARRLLQQDSESFTTTTS